MDKLEIQKRVLKNRKPLDLNLFTWDEETKTFSSFVNGLVLDFRDFDGLTFKTGSYCTFKTGSHCTFKTVSDCVFNTGSWCAFDTMYDCVFKTGSWCFVTRRDVHEIIDLVAGQKIKLNRRCIKGYEIIKDKHTIVIDGKEIELSEESYKSLKESLK